MQFHKMLALSDESRLVMGVIKPMSINVVNIELRHLSSDTSSLLSQKHSTKYI